MAAGTGMMKVLRVLCELRAFREHTTLGLLFGDVRLGDGSVGCFPEIAMHLSLFYWAYRFTRHKRSPLQIMLRRYGTAFMQSSPGFPIGLGGLRGIVSYTSQLSENRPTMP